MNEATKTLRASTLIRWLALIVASFTMFGAYYFNYAMSPVKPLLESALGWNSADFGTYTSAYAWFNVFLFMLIFSGMILDHFGIRFTGFLATILMTLGTGLNYWALIHHFPEGSHILGLKMQVAISALGFAIFGVGTEAGGITVTKAVVKWFKGKEMALAMGMQMSIARLGTATALAIALPVALKYGYAAPAFLAFLFMIFGLISFAVYSLLDYKIDKQIKEQQVAADDEKFRLKDIKLIVTNRGFWYIAILCVLFYSAVFPFMFYATDLVINKYHVAPKFAGLIPALLPLGTIFLTPVFGSIYDRLGKGATIMIIGSVMLIIVHGVLAIPSFNNMWVAVFMVILLGIAFSLVPAAMWPSVPKILPERVLGTSYAVIFWIQNIGLMLVPLLLGVVLNSTNPDVVPNKKLIKESFRQSYAQVLGHKCNLTDKEIEKFADIASAQLVDSIVRTAYYEEVPNSQVNLEEVKTQLSTATVQALQSVDCSLAKDKLKETVIRSSVAAAYPIIVSHKLNIRYNYFWDMILFTTLATLALIFALLLKREDRIKGYGLEKPNIVKEE